MKKYTFLLENINVYARPTTAVIYAANLEEAWEELTPKEQKRIIQVTEEPMTCKEIRAAQLDALKNGIATASYILQETHHDGRIVRRLRFETQEEMEKAAAIERRKCEPYTHIMCFAEFQI